jgi:uncharacterized protein YkwD
MRKFILLIILAITLGGFFWSEILDFYSKLTLRLPQQWTEERTNDLIEEVEKQIATPPPLRAEKEAPESFLTQAGIIQWSNFQREKYGLPPLKENAKLDSSAEIKVEDMLENQYFAHSSLSGVGVKELAERVGYEFIAIGENLALGNFQNDEALLQAWMDSPGHRENILNIQYQEIGVAVIKGVFKGQTTWLAVQHFGLPLSACSQPDETLKVEIETNQNQIEELQQTLEVLQTEIQIMRPKRGPAYNQKIEQYNAIVSQYNNLVDEKKVLISQYNAQVKLFNDCVTGVE